MNTLLLVQYLQKRWAGFFFVKETIIGEVLKLLFEKERFDMPHSENHDDDSPKAPVDWKSIAATWLTQQGVSTILVFLMFLSAWYAAGYLANVAIPAHLQSIKAGYEVMEERHQKERDDRDKRYSEEREKDRQLLREFLFNGGKKIPNTSSLDDAS